MLTQAHVYIKGDIIGVGFRAWTKIQAKIHHVTGWVRNVHDRSDIFGPSGGVEAVVQGEREQVDTLLELLKKGSPICYVQSVQITPQEPKEIIEGFEIRK